MTRAMLAATAAIMTLIAVYLLTSSGLDWTIAVAIALAVLCAVGLRTEPQLRTILSPAVAVIGLVAYAAIGKEPDLAIPAVGIALGYLFGAAITR